jgi:hypothetical protein
MFVATLNSGEKSGSSHPKFLTIRSFVNWAYKCLDVRTEAHVRTPATRSPLNPARARLCITLAPVHSRIAERTFSGNKNRLVENGDALAPLPLRRVPRRVVVSHALPLVAPTHLHALEHACPPCCSPRPARPVVACPRPASACLAMPPRLARPMGTTCTHETLIAWKTCCNVRLK